MADALYPWLASYWNELIQEQQQGRLPHALILSAVDGLGVNALVSQISQLLLCKTPENNRACQQCTSCQLFQAGTHPDLYYLSVEEKKTQISVEQVRALIAKLTEKAHQSGYRIAIVEPAHLMNKASANALLKTLEEPGDDTLLVLVTERLNALPATIRSRCRIMNISAPTEAEALDYVQEHHPDNTKTDRIAVRIAQNRPLQALEILNSGILQERQDFFAYLQGIRTQSLEPTTLYKNFKDKAKLMTFCDWLLDLQLDLEKYEAGVPVAELLNNDQQQLIHALERLSTEQRMQWHKALIEAKRLLLSSSNINPKLLLDNMLLNWIAFFR